ncbi:uncharacterized protein [Hetaerina americana]|uniref:uncharacterized protein n=1 Tax=Hetaerina americana TaxID=62018 RepID=UPI003A7F24E1
MESPVGTGLGGHGCRLTPGRKTPSRWRSVTSPLPIYTSTPLDHSPRNPASSCFKQLLEWEVSSILSDRSETNTTPLAARSPNVGPSLGPWADRTPTTTTPLLRRRINRRILANSPADGEDRSPPVQHQSPASDGFGSTLGPSPCRPRPARYIQKQRAMVKRFMVSKKKLSMCKILNDNRGGLRL